MRDNHCPQTGNHDVRRNDQAWPSFANFTADRRVQFTKLRRASSPDQLVVVPVAELGANKAVLTRFCKGLTFFGPSARGSPFIGEVTSDPFSTRISTRSSGFAPISASNGLGMTMPVITQL